MISFLKYWKLEDIDIVYKLLNKYSNEVGFVIKPSIIQASKNNEVIIYKELNQIAGICKFHKRRDNFVVIYEIIVDEYFRKKGIGKKLISFLLKRNNKIILKCPIDNEANKFYQKIGAVLLRIEKGKKRNLNVYGIDKIL